MFDVTQAAQRGKSQAAPSSQIDPDDPLKDKYGDLPLIQSKEQTGRKFLQIKELSQELKGQEVGSYICHKSDCFDLRPLTLCSAACPNAMDSYAGAA